MRRNVLKKNGGKNAPHTLEKKTRKEKNNCCLINQFFELTIQNQFKGENGRKCESKNDKKKCEYNQTCDLSII